MHAVVAESLEEYLSGSLEPAAQQEIEVHLRDCSMCREEVRAMQDVSLMFGSLRSEETVEPRPGFFNAVMQRAGERSTTPRFANLFGLDLVFERRLAFASLLMLVVMGGFLAAHEARYPVRGPSPETVMAQENSPAFETAKAEDNMLVTLTAYEQRY